MSLILPCLLVFAQQHALAGVCLTVDAVGIDGGTTTGSCSLIDSAITGVFGISSNAGSGVSLVAGYALQLYDVTGLVVRSSSAAVAENGEVRLDAVACHDDATYEADADVVWTPVAGPVVSIESDGLAHAGPVFCDTQAIVEAQCGYIAVQGSFNVLDSNRDNYGLYSGDGAADDWQVGYFGFDNPLGAAIQDGDNDGENNLMEFIAGTSPVDEYDFFTLSIRRGSLPDQRVLELSPVFPDRTYQAEVSADLMNGAWGNLEQATEQTNGLLLEVTDTAATNAVRFYRAMIHYEW